jgi:diguanylate cyclase (GGDEF)-like protein
MKILIAEDDMVSRRVLQAILQKWGHEVVIAQDGIEALAAFQLEDAPPLAVLDWMMPGLDGIEVCRKVREISTITPAYIILLTAKGNKEDLVTGLDAGADDYLTKPFDRTELRARIKVGERVVSLQQKLAEHVEELNKSVVELKEAETEIRNLSMQDELTGLYNRRGFLVLSEQHRKTARRAGKSFSLIYGDMDGLKQINDTYGHHAGSEAIRQIAEIFKQSFRASDIIARIGGDEFTILISDATSGNLSIPLDRLQENLSSYNSQNPHPYNLALSIGSICVDSDDDSSIEELLEKADESMYENKRRKREAYRI